MKKITNNQINILVGHKIPKVVTKRQDIKVSLNEIQKLSTQIDMQFIKNQQKKKNISKGYYQTNQTNDNRRELPQQQQQSQDDSSNILQKKNNQYKQFQQDNPFTNNSTTMDKAVYMSIMQYYYGLKQYIESCNNNNKIDKELQIEQFSQYKRISKFNRDFIEIKDKLEKLRRVTLCQRLGRVQVQQQQQQQQIDDLLYQSESDVIKMIKHIVLHKERSETNNNKNNDSNNTNINLLQCINTIQQIKQTIQSKIQHLIDDIQHKQSILAQLQTNKQNILDDIDIIQSRNNKLRKQLGTYQNNRHQDINNSNRNKLNYGNSNNHSREQSQQQQQQQQQEQQQQLQQQQQQQQEQQQQQPQEQEQQYLDCQQQYLQLMQLYHLYNPQTKTITTTFPKNKTQAMSMLNQLDTQIMQLQFKKTLKIIQNNNQYQY